MSTRECCECGRVRHLVAEGLCGPCYTDRVPPAELNEMLVHRGCSIGGCRSFAVASGLCERHYRRRLRHGSTDQTRPGDWGDREKHPLYNHWCSMRRVSKVTICPEWDDFWTFVREIGDRPSDSHRLFRKSVRLPYQKDNVIWRQSRASELDLHSRRDGAAYMRDYRKRNVDYHRSRELERRFGITMDEYQAKLAAQGGVCAICRQLEQAMDKRTGKAFALAVDHCHETGDVRDLLCASCNGMLGQAHDDPDRLRAAIAYLERHRRPKVVPTLAADGSPRDYLTLIAASPASPAVN